MTKWTSPTRIAPIVIFLAIAIFLAIGLTRDPKLIPSEMIDRDLPEFTLSDLHIPEATVSQDDFLGQISLLNVFGSWCVGCVVEHPTLIDIARRGEVQIIGINWRDTREDGLAWLERFGDPYTRIGFDDESDLAIELGVTGAPETYIVDQTGRIRYKHIGAITPEVYAEIIAPMIADLQLEAS